MHPVLFFFRFLHSPTDKRRSGGERAFAQQFGDAKRKHLGSELELAERTMKLMKQFVEDLARFQNHIGLCKVKTSY
jgi:hypothetical protein